MHIIIILLRIQDNNYFQYINKIKHNHLGNKDKYIAIIVITI